MSKKKREAGNGQSNEDANRDFLGHDNPLREVTHVSGMYEHWFLDYASYVILERAVPHINDGLKPVQRRILHAMKEMDDGRFNKVANLIGSTMQFHPHGDASIGDAIIGLGQKDLLIETQGNWGDIRTGDAAAAPRYIEARLSKFALDVVFNTQTTGWQLSYDGRKKEPITFPVKFPLLLAQGVEGIAVGLSTRILPHNFVELLHACMQLLKGKKPKILPDFPTGGLADFTDYNEGKRGGKVRIRAKIEEQDKKTLMIRDIPFGTTTTSLIDSIIKANDKGKIKVKKVVDNTARDVEVLVYLAPGQSPDITIDALYAFTDCEVSISPNACIILDDTPVFLGVDDILNYSNEQTVDLLRRELEIKKGELQEKILFSSLEKIFIENRIYRDIEECETWEAVIETIDRGLEPFKPQFYREITKDDIVRLTEIKIKRISKFDAFKSEEQLKKLQEELEQTEHHLRNLTDFAVDYYQNLIDTYGKGRERKTEIKTFDTIQATIVAANNSKLYINREEGFIGHGIRKDEFVCDCSDLDDIIVFRSDGKMVVTRISDKVFVGKHIIYAGIFRRDDERMVYNMAYLDGATGRTMVKRFRVMSITRDKEYDLTRGSDGSRVLYFTANPNGEAEVVNVQLSNRCRARNKVFDFNFSDIDIKGRSAGGNILSRYPIRKIQLKAEGKSTLGGVDVFYDAAIGRLNRDERGRYLGNFKHDDLILVVETEGTYALTTFELTNRYDPERVLALEKFDPDRIITAIYTEGESKHTFVKRFQIETRSVNKKFSFVSDHRLSRLLFASTGDNPVVEITIRKKKAREKQTIKAAEIIEVKGWKALGNRLSKHPVISVKSLAGDTKAVSREDKHARKQEDTGKSRKAGVVKSETRSKDPSRSQPAETKKDRPDTRTTAGPDSDKSAAAKGKQSKEQQQDGNNSGEGGFHAGDTVDLPVDHRKTNSDKDQLGLFGEDS